MQRIRRYVTNPLYLFAICCHLICGTIFTLTLAKDIRENDLKHIPCNGFRNGKFYALLNASPKAIEVIHRAHGQESIVFALDRTGKRICRLTKTYIRENVDVAVSPNGLQIALSAHTHGYETDVFLADIEGGNLVNVSESLYFPARSPIWSPDGKAIAFSYGDVGESTYVASSEGNLIDVIDWDGVPIHKNPVMWSPSSLWIAVAVGDGPISDPEPGIYLMDRKASDVRRLTAVQKDGLYANPTWSDDGTAITFLSGGRYNETIHEYEFQEQCTITLETEVTQCESLE